MTDPLAISFENVELSFSGKKVLKGLSFAVPRGQLVAMLGPNGAGKSTSIALALGSRLPDAGQVFLFGKSARDPSVRSQRSVTPQELSFPQALKPLEILKLIRTHGCTEHSASEIESWIDRLDFRKMLHRPCFGLSGGEKRKLGFLATLIQDADLVILDEPSTGLDVASRRVLWDIISEQKKRGKTILLCSHDLHEIENLADRILLMDSGQIKLDGSVEQIKSRVSFQHITLGFSLGQVPATSVADAQARFLSEITQGPGFLSMGNVFLETRPSGDADLKYLLRLGFMVRDADTYVRWLVGKQIQFEDLRVEASSLEEALYRKVRDVGDQTSIDQTTSN